MTSVVIIALGNDLVWIRCQTLTWINVELLSFGPSGNHLFKKFNQNIGHKKSIYVISNVFEICWTGFTVLIY